MKKLMFTAAVAAGLAAFGEGLESANTVGFQNIPRYSTFTFGGSMFTDVGQSYYTMNNVS